MYNDVQFNYVDACMASVLSPGGVCHYETIDPGVTANWIGAVVTPQIKAVFGLSVELLLGKAILQLVFSPHQDHMPSDMHNQIVTADAEQATIEHGKNPICHLVTVTGDNTCIYMEDVSLDGG